MNLAWRWYYEEKLNLSQVAIGDKGAFRRRRAHESPAQSLDCYRPTSHDFCKHLTGQAFRAHFLRRCVTDAPSDLGLRGLTELYHPRLPGFPIPVLRLRRNLFAHPLQPASTYLVFFLTLGKKFAEVLNVPDGN